VIILSNCLTDIVDEGCRKVANSLVKRIKAAEPESIIVSYESCARISDVHFNINKLMLSKDLAALLKQKQQPLVYIPMPARGISTAVRACVLSAFAKWGLKTVLVMRFPMSGFSKLLLKLSRTEIYTVSCSSWEYYRDIIGERAKYIKVGVDTRRFTPIDESQKKLLRKKYSLPEEKPIVLHVGHLKEGRNIRKLLEIDKNFHCILVVSTKTADETDKQLEKELKQSENITVIDRFVPAIQEIYQLSDVYLFPVVERQNCIDSPLSALEAASCGIPVVTTGFGEMSQLLNSEGFYPLEDFAPEKLNALIKKAAIEKLSPRDSVLEYDWNNAIKNILS